MAFREYLIGEVAQDRVDGLISRRQALLAWFGQHLA
jgi:hypothetical protein